MLSYFRTVRLATLICQYFILTLSCQSPDPAPKQMEMKRMEMTKPHALFSDTAITLNVNGRRVECMYPDSTPKGVIWIFHGWNFDPLDWCNKTDLCKKALSKGYMLVLPDMKKSIYASHFYPETWPSLRQEATLGYVTDTLIPFLKDSIFKTNYTHYIMGLSTGAHGAGLIVEKTDHFFSACALLSGDYDQTLLPQDRIFQANYGMFSQFPKRWKNDDNVVTGAVYFQIPVWIGHGIQDPIIPQQQSIHLADQLKKIHPHQTVELQLTQGKHDWPYWHRQTDAVLDFFERIMVIKE